MDLTEAEDTKRWQEYTEELYKKHLHNPGNHDGVITHLEPDILEYEVKWALGSITTNKAGRGNRIPVELLQILKDDTVKVLHSICQKIWKTQQWTQDLVQSLSHVRLFVTPWTAARQASLSITNSQRMLKLLHYCTHLTC